MDSIDEAVFLARGLGFNAERAARCGFQLQDCTCSVPSCTPGSRSSRVCGQRPEHPDILHGDPDKLRALADMRAAYASRMRAIGGGYA